MKIFLRKDPRPPVFPAAPLTVAAPGTRPKSSPWTEDRMKETWAPAQWGSTPPRGKARRCRPRQRRWTWRMSRCWNSRRRTSRVTGSHSHVGRTLGATSGCRRTTRRAQARTAWAVTGGERVGEGEEGGGTNGAGRGLDSGRWPLRADADPRNTRLTPTWSHQPMLPQQF